MDVPFTTTALQLTVTLKFYKNDIKSNEFDGLRLQLVSHKHLTAIISPVSWAGVRERAALEVKGDGEEPEEPLDSHRQLEDIRARSRSGVMSLRHNEED